MTTTSLRRLAARSAPEPKPRNGGLFRIQFLRDFARSVTPGSTIEVHSVGAAASFDTDTGTKSGDAELADALEQAWARRER